MSFSIINLIYFLKIIYVEKKKHFILNFVSFILHLSINLLFYLLMPLHVAQI